MARLVNVATCNLNCWAMDFNGNLERIEASIREAKAKGCTFRTGPELEITGYGCEDHFLEQDTFVHAWDTFARLLTTDVTDGILCDVGMPVMHRNVAYNCRVIVLNRKIVGIRPKFYLANDGNYREMRWFTPWYIDPKAPGFGPLQEYYLPRSISAITDQTTVPIGIFAVSTLDTAVRRPPRAPLPREIPLHPTPPRGHLPGPPPPPPSGLVRVDGERTPPRTRAAALLARPHSCFRSPSLRAGIV